jgi:hypothetical protein
MMTAYVYAAGKSWRILEIMYRATLPRLAPWQVETLAGTGGAGTWVPCATPL